MAEKKSTKLIIPISPTEKEKIFVAAHENRLTLSAFVRMASLQAAEGGLHE